MKQLLNTLYVTTQGAYLARDGDTISVRVEQEVALRVPIHTLSSVVCFGRVSSSPPLMGLCAEHGVALSFLTENGRFLARVEGPVSGNVLLRREQYRWADDEDKSAGIARSAVIAKIANCRTVLLRASREKPDGGGRPELEAAAHRLGQLVDELQKPMPLDTVRGHEGDAARVYFGVFDYLITESKDAFFFRERSRRPPLDNINALLSFLYTLLTHDAAAALECVGLDPAVGYLHRDRPGRSSLALDLVEELRPVIADRLALSLINRRQIGAAGFHKTESGAVEMDAGTRKEVLVAYQKRKQEEILHPFLKERVAFGIVPHTQAMLLARHLRGDLDAYPVSYGDDAMMLVVVAYDVSTESDAGKKRLRRVAKVCEDVGQRVQNSVFECLVDAAQWTKLRARLVSEAETSEDSLRFYFLGDNWHRRVEHVGAKKTYDPQGPLVV